jgi:hypothetical protein
MEGIYHQQNLVFLPAFITIWSSMGLAQYKQLVFLQVKIYPSPRLKEWIHYFVSAT